MALSIPRFAARSVGSFDVAAVLLATGLLLIATGGLSYVPRSSIRSSEPGATRLLRPLLRQVEDHLAQRTDVTGGVECSNPQMQ